MSGRRNPFEEIEQVLERMGRQLDRSGLRPASAPMDVADHHDRFVVTVELPGYEREEVSVTLQDGTVSVEAEHETDETETDETDAVRYIRRERSRESVSRSVRLPEPVAADDVTATFGNGVLAVDLPKETPREDDGDGYQIDVE